MRVMPIIRSRTGCFTCRRRKKKCNEEKPVCSGCRRNKLDCRWPAQQLSTQGLCNNSGSNKSPSTLSSPSAAAPYSSLSPLLTHVDAGDEAFERERKRLRSSPELLWPLPCLFDQAQPSLLQSAPSCKATLETLEPKACKRLHVSELDGAAVSNDLSSLSLCFPPHLSPPSACSYSPSPHQHQVSRPATNRPFLQQRNADKDKEGASHAQSLACPSPTNSTFSDDSSLQHLPDYGSSGGLDVASPEQASSLADAGHHSQSSITTRIDGVSIIRASYSKASHGTLSHGITSRNKDTHLNPSETPGSAIDKFTAPLSLVPSHSSHDSYELLSYYLSRTADSMGNGSTNVNPFVAKLIPLAFSNPLVLQLLLAQSAAHRQASKNPTAATGCEVAQRYYTDSLRMFRNVVGDHVSGKDENTLTLTVGSLILCLTEVARGDINGTIFDHLTASRSLLTMLLSSRPKLDLLQDLPEFLVEYYMHTAASSMISMDMAGANIQTLLSPSIEAMARTLVGKQYIGQLCGCWLELLILIPQVFQLGRGILSRVAQGKTPLADDIITYGLLQSHILSYFPSSAASPYSQLAGLVFKQGVLLYLWSILETPQQGSCLNGAHRDLMQGAVSEVVALLAQFPASARVNTSLCWPLAVVGCCTEDRNVQDIVRQRLRVMIQTIGLGNMRETLILLERVWSQPPEKTSPWTLSKTMQEHQIWISFA